MEAKGRTNLPNYIWRRRRGVAFLSVSLIIFAASPLILDSMRSGLALIGFLFSAWAVCIGLTFVGAMIGGRGRKNDNPPASQKIRSDQGDL